MPSDAILTYADHVADRPLTPRLRNRSGPDSYADYLRIHYRFYQDAALPPKPPMIPTVPAFVNAGRWVWQCAACYEGGMVEPGEAAICAHCGDGWVMPTLPANRAAIEEELLRQPGRRHNAPVRHWRPGWTLDTLRARTAKANALIAAGEANPRALSIGATRVWVTGEILTASNENLYISTPIDDLSGDNGIVEFRDSLQVLDGAGDKVIWTPGGTTAQRPISPSNGQIRYNTDDHHIDLRANGDWQQLAHLTDLPEVTYETLNANGDVGGGADQIARGTHGHIVQTTTFADVSPKTVGGINQDVWTIVFSVAFDLHADTTHLVLMSTQAVHNNIPQWRFSIDSGATFSNVAEVGESLIQVLTPGTSGATIMQVSMYREAGEVSQLSSRDYVVAQFEFGTT